MLLLVFRLVIAGVVAIYAPYLIVSSHPTGAGIGSGALTVAGSALVAIGAATYLGCVRDFVVIGPPSLVARGTYRYVRNPMYLGLVLVLCGESLVFESWRLAGYTATIGLAVHLVVVLYEERELRKRLGQSYADYCNKVPRWLPRLGPAGR